MITFQKAIVIGGGIAGKLAARVLSDFVQEVVILEKDTKSTDPEPRTGVRQGEHLHALLHAGQYGLEALFPGITEKCHQSGAVNINSTLDLAWYHQGVWKKRYDGGYSTTLQTRPHLEWQIEQYIEEIPNITYLYHVQVKNYEYDESQNRVCGVTYQTQDGSTCTMKADLVVDASGASSMTSRWLEKRELAIPHQKVEIGLSYVSKMVQLPEDSNRDWKIKLIYPNPPHEKLGGTISKVEKNRYMVTLIGYGHSISEKEVLKHDQGFLDLAKQLTLPDIYEEIKGAKTLTDTTIFRVPHIIWRQIHKVKNFPNGLLVLGDSVCRIDPVFGQGMSLSVLQTLALKKILNDHHGSLQPAVTAFHQKIARIIGPIWNMVLTEDFRYSEVKGPKPLGVTIQQWYARQIFLLSAKDQAVYDSFIKVMNLMKPITYLMQPTILAKVLKHHLFR